MPLDYFLQSDSASLQRFSISGIVFRIVPTCDGLFNQRHSLCIFQIFFFTFLSLSSCIFRSISSSIGVVCAPRGSGLSRLDSQIYLLTTLRLSSHNSASWLWFQGSVVSIVSALSLLFARSFSSDVLSKLLRRQHSFMWLTQIICSTFLSCSLFHK